jgi:hypothetical protein
VEREGLEGSLEREHHYPSFDRQRSLGARGRSTRCQMARGHNSYLESDISCQTMVHFAFAMSNRKQYILVTHVVDLGTRMAVRMHES